VGGGGGRVGGGWEAKAHPAPAQRPPAQIKNQARPQKTNKKKESAHPKKPTNQGNRGGPKGLRTVGLLPPPPGGGGVSRDQHKSAGATKTQTENNLRGARDGSGRGEGEGGGKGPLTPGLPSPRNTKINN